MTWTLGNLKAPGRIYGVELFSYLQEQNGLAWSSYAKFQSLSLERKQALLVKICRSVVSRKLDVVSVISETWCSPYDQNMYSETSVNEKVTDKRTTYDTRMLPYLFFLSKPTAMYVSISETEVSKGSPK